MKKSLAKLAAVTVLALVGAGTNSLAANSEARADQPANWTINEAVDVNAINSDLVPGRPTIDVGIYFWAHIYRCI